MAVITIQTPEPSFQVVKEIDTDYYGPFTKSALDAILVDVASAIREAEREAATEWEEQDFSTTHDLYEELLDPSVM